MANQYFFARGKRQFGPFSGARLKELAASGRLEPTDTIWKHGMKQGVVAGTVRKLFHAARAEARPDDTAIAPAKTPSPVAPDPATAPADSHGTPAQPALAIKPPEPTYALVPIEEDPEPGALPAPPPPSGTDAREKAVPAQAPSGVAPGAPHKWRAEAVRGAVIVSQDGATVHYRKKCSKCGHEATSRNSMPIRTGATTASFFCPKCKKLRDVVIRGSA